MVVNDNFIKYISNWDNFKKHIIQLVVILITVHIFVFITIYMFLGHLATNYSNSLKSAYIPPEYTKKEELLVKCKQIKCIKVYSLDQTGTWRAYDFDNRGLTPDILVYKGNHSPSISSYTKYLTNKYYNLNIKDGNEIYVVNDADFLSTISNYTLLLHIAISILFVLTTIYNMYLSYKSYIYEKSNYKLYTGHKIQGNITEMIHHELVAPIAILKSVAVELGRILNIDNSNEHEELMISLKYSTERLETVLGTLYEDRTVRNSNSNSNSIYALLNYSISTINRIRVGRLEVEFNNGSDLDSYALRKLTNGDFLNILNVMLTNSIEASASLITYDIEILPGGYCYLYITDNGTGIRDSNNKLVSNPEKYIYAYGYSSKIKPKSSIVENWISKLLSKLKVHIVKTDTDRGIGLYMNKVLLHKAGGRIELVKTSCDGTTFRLKLPIVKLEFD